MRVVAARILPDRNLANEVQVEFTFEKLALRIGDWKSVGQHMDAGKPFPTKKFTEVRAYASEAVAVTAIKNLAPHLATL